MDRKDKKIVLLNWYIILQPVIDIVTSLGVRYGSSSITLGVVIRALFVCIMVLYMMFFYHGKYEKVIKLYVALISIYGIIFLTNAVLCSGMYTIITNVKMFIKMYYFLYVLLGFFCMYQQHNYLVSDYLLVIVYCEYTISILLSTISNTSFGTYNYGKGYCGWFYAGNEVGAIVSILAIVALLFSVISRNKYIWIIMGGLCAFSGTYIGTKVPLLASVMAIVILCVLFVLQKVLYKTSSKKLVRCVCVLLIYCLLYMLNSPAQQNNEIMVTEHYETNVVEKELDNNQQEGEDLSDVSENKTYLIINWIMSNRLVSVEDSVGRYCNGTLTEKLFGLGYCYNIGNIVQKNLIEMDFVALVICHGLIGFIIYVIPIFCFAFVCMKKIWIFRKNLLKNENLAIYTYGILIGLACAVVSGHVLIAPAVSIYIAILIVKLYSLLVNRNNFEQ